MFSFRSLVWYQLLENNWYQSSKCSANFHWKSTIFFIKFVIFHWKIICTRGVQNLVGKVNFSFIIRHLPLKRYLSTCGANFHWNSAFLFYYSSPIEELFVHVTNFHWKSAFLFYFRYLPSKSYSPICSTFEPKCKEFKTLFQ